MASQKVKKKALKARKLEETGMKTTTARNDYDTYQDILERALSSGVSTFDLIRTTQPELQPAFTKWCNEVTRPLAPQSNLQFWNRVHQTPFDGQTGLFNYLEQCSFETISLGTYRAQQLRLEPALQPFEIMYKGFSDPAIREELRGTINSAIAVQVLYSDATNPQENKAGEISCCQPLGWLLVHAEDSWVRTGHVVLLDSDQMVKKELWIVLAKGWQKTRRNEYCENDSGYDSPQDGEEDSSQFEQEPDVADVGTTTFLTPEHESLPGQLVRTTVAKLIFLEINGLLQNGESQEISFQSHGQRWQNCRLKTCLAELHRWYLAPIRCKPKRLVLDDGQAATGSLTSKYPVRGIDTYIIPPVSAVLDRRLDGTPVLSSPSSNSLKSSLSSSNGNQDCTNSRISEEEMDCISKDASPIHARSTDALGFEWDTESFSKNVDSEEMGIKTQPTKI